MSIMVEATCDDCEEGYIETVVGIDDGVNSLESQLEGDAYFEGGSYICHDCAQTHPKE